MHTKGNSVNCFKKTEGISWDRGEMCVIKLSGALKVALLLTCYSALGQTQAEESGALECSKLGFTGLGLCSDCDSLATFVKDAELERDCRACCVSGDDVAAYSLAARATLEVCPRRIMYYPVVRGHTDCEVDMSGRTLAIYVSGRCESVLKMYHLSQAVLVA